MERGIWWRHDPSWSGNSLGVPKRPGVIVGVCAQRGRARHDDLGSIETRRDGEQRRAEGPGSWPWWATTGSDKLWPVVVWHENWTSPFLAIGVGAPASNEIVVGVLKDGDPRRGLGMLHPLQVSC